MARKLKMKVIASTPQGEDDLVQEHHLEALEGAVRRRVFYVEVGNRPPMEAHQLLQNVRKHYKGTEIPEFGEDFFVPMRDGKPQCKIEFWEEETNEFEDPLADD